ncbi:kinase-like domain-containing protein [Rhizophagus clarus]|uniref:Kinase-like domain-containing protein n=1 Tax=Rhizophagus clarus TaxID=94130 RepID=A0A8H3QCI8_9GLOM|nr:kinase-like domain-containing protein [Rhizophagus clarus]
MLSISLVDGFLNEWDCERPEIIENTPQCYVDLMKICWNGDPLKRPSASKVFDIITNWIFRPDDGKVSELESNIMEFINAQIGNNHLTTESHPKACYKSRLHNFTSKEVNENLGSYCLDCIVDDEKN